MDNEQSSIHDFDLTLICDYFLSLERQGPGSPETTLKALSFIENLTQISKVADIGCGTGGQTMVLAQHVPGSITGVDLFPGFIGKFNTNSQKKGLQQRVKGLVGNMEQLPFQTEELDLIWSEGAIYNIGFERGMNEWRQYLKKGGFIAVSEASWLTGERPAEIETFWYDAYPEIDTIANKIAQMQKAGFTPIATFVLPESCWIDHFYAPQSAVQQTFLKKHAGNHAAKAFIDSERYEAQLYDRYKEFYGYVFYIGKKM